MNVKFLYEKTENKSSEIYERYLYLIDNLNFETKIPSELFKELSIKSFSNYKLDNSNDFNVSKILTLSGLLYEENFINIDERWFILEEYYEFLNQYHSREKLLKLMKTYENKMYFQWDKFLKVEDLNFAKISFINNDMKKEVIAKDADFCRKTMIDLLSNFRLRNPDLMDLLKLIINTSKVKNIEIEFEKILDLDETVINLLDTVGFTIPENSVNELLKEKKIRYFYIKNIETLLRKKKIKDSPKLFDFCCKLDISKETLVYFIEDLGYDKKLHLNYYWPVRRLIYKQDSQNLLYLESKGILKDMPKKSIIESYPKRPSIELNDILKKYL